MTSTFILTKTEIIKMENVALLNLRHLKSVVKQREEALRVAERRLEDARRDFERALAVTTVPNMTVKQLRELMQ